MKNTLFILFLGSFLVALLAFGYYVHSLTEASNTQWINLTPSSTNKDDKKEKNHLHQAERADFVPIPPLEARVDSTNGKLKESVARIDNTIYRELEGGVISINNEQLLKTKSNDIPLFTKDSLLQTTETLTDTKNDTHVNNIGEVSDSAETIVSSVDYSETSGSPDSVSGSSSHVQAEDIGKVFAPRGIWHKIIDNKIILYWNAANKAEGYRVSHRNARGIEVENFDILGRLSFTHANGNATIPQYYQISTLYSGLESEPSATYVIKPSSIYITADSANL
jgi:hypothetical protein